MIRSRPILRSAFSGGSIVTLLAPFGTTLVAPFVIVGPMVSSMLRVTGWAGCRGRKRGDGRANSRPRLLCTARKNENATESDRECKLNDFHFLATATSATQETISRRG